MQETITCKNCQTPYQGHFCPSCGQSAHTGRIDFHYILHDLPHSVFHVDKGLFFTMGQLLTRPGRALGEYLDGRRVKHFRPVAYLVILTSVATLLSHLHELVIKDAVTESAHAAAPASGLGHFIARIAPFFNKYPSLVFLITIPLLALITWLFYRQRNFNYWENVVANTYLVAQYNLVMIALSLYAIVTRTHHLSFTIPLIIFLLYLGFAYGQLFSYKRKPVNILYNVALMTVVVFLYLTILSLTGIMTPWWGS